MFNSMGIHVRLRSSSAPPQRSGRMMRGFSPMSNLGFVFLLDACARKK